VRSPCAAWRLPARSASSSCSAWRSCSLLVESRRSTYHALTLAARCAAGSCSSSSRQCRVDRPRFPTVRRARCSPAVPLETPLACRAPTRSANNHSPLLASPSTGLASGISSSATKPRAPVRRPSMNPRRDGAQAACRTPASPREHPRRPRSRSQRHRSCPMCPADRRRRSRRV